MKHELTTTSDRPLFGTLAAHALAAGTPQPVVAEAVGAVAMRFPRSRGAEGASRARIEAYFWGVVRRRALQGAAPAVSRRIVIASLEQELREAGHTPEAIRSEVLRQFGELAPGVDAPAGQSAPRVPRAAGARQ